MGMKLIVIATVLLLVLQRYCTFASENEFKEMDMSASVDFGRETELVKRDTGNVSTHSSSIQGISSGFPCFGCLYLACTLGIIGVIRLLVTGLIFTLAFGVHCIIPFWVSCTVTVTNSLSFIDCFAPCQWALYCAGVGLIVVLASEVCRIKQLNFLSCIFTNIGLNGFGCVPALSLFVGIAAFPLAITGLIWADYNIIVHLCLLIGIVAPVDQIVLANLGISLGVSLSLFIDVSLLLNVGVTALVVAG